MEAQDNIASEWQKQNLSPDSLILYSEIDFLKYFSYTLVDIE